MPTIISADVIDVRFPTSLTSDGSDAMNPDGDHSAAYVVLRTDDDSLAGHGLTFTLGRGTQLCAEAARLLAGKLVGLPVAGLRADLGAVYRDLLADTQLRWLGPEKGVVHLAKAAVMNAVWDLAARAEAKPLWQLLAGMSPAEMVSLCDFRYLTDALTPGEATGMLSALEPTRAERIAELTRRGVPAYSTSPGWLGYDDETLRRKCREAIDAGFSRIKLKVGACLEDDVRRCGIVRDEIGPGRALMIDANQVWDVPEAVSWIKQLSQFDPLWVEEPTSPDDILGHAQIRAAVHPVGVATGEHAHNRVMFKQLLQAGAIDYCQIDSCRLASVNEILPVLLLAAKFGVPVCPHAGGVGLCEYVQHLSIVDYVCVSGSLDGRVTEYVDHLREHFDAPAVVIDGRYQVPAGPGYGVRIREASLSRFTYPHGDFWASRDQPGGRP